MPADTAATPKPWRSPLGEACGPSRPAACHHRMHGAPAGHARPRPEPFATALAAAGLVLADAVHQVERVEQGRGDGHGAIDAGPALLQALDHQHAGGEVHAIGGEGEGLGQPAAGIGEGHAEGAHLAIGALGFAQEGVALAGGEVFPGAVRGVQPHADLRDRRGAAGQGRGLSGNGMPGPGPARPWRGRGGSTLALAFVRVVTPDGPGSRGGAWRGRAGRGR